MEKSRDVRICDMRKMFPKWSHGTLYNRLKKLNLKDNSKFMSKNSTGSILYNFEAVELLKVEYLKDFTQCTEADRKEIDNHILSVLSNEDISSSTENKDPGIINNVDKKPSQVDIDVVNLAYINKNYVSNEIYQEKVEELKDTIRELKTELEKEKEDKKNNYITKEHHNDVVNVLKEQLNNANEIVKFKEQKDIYMLQETNNKSSEIVVNGSEERQTNDIMIKEEKISWWKKLFYNKNKNS